jgi:hypothetical protein
LPGIYAESPARDAANLDDWAETGCLSARQTTFTDRYLARSGDSLAPNSILTVKVEREVLALTTRSVGDISINWTWSHHKFETDLFSVCGPTNRVDLILCGFLRRSKRPAISDIGPCPIRAIARGQFFDAG